MQKELRDIIRKMIERAKNYPFDIPNYSYVFINGNAFKLVKFNLHSLMDSIIQVNEGRQKLRRYLHLKKIDLSLDFPDCFSGLFSCSCLWIKCLVHAITREIFKF